MGIVIVFVNQGMENSFLGFGVVYGGRINIQNDLFFGEVIVYYNFVVMYLYIGGNVIIFCCFYQRMEKEVINYFQCVFLNVFMGLVDGVMGLKVDNGFLVLFGK